MLCNYEDSDLIGKDDQQIIIDDWQVTKKIEFRKLFTKGPKYRENNSNSWEGDKRSIMEHGGVQWLYWDNAAIKIRLKNLSSQNGKIKSEARLMNKWKQYPTIHLANTIKMCSTKRDHCILWIIFVLSLLLP